MRKLRASSWTAAAMSTALLVMGSVTSSAAAADPGEATHVDSLVAGVVGGMVQVSGQATFVDFPVLLGEDPAGDAAISGVGADVTNIFVARPNPAKATLEFTFEVADQMSTGPAIAPVITHAWPFFVDDSSRQFFLDARSASVAGPTSASPSFLLREVTNSGIESIATLNGSMGDGIVRWEVPMSRIDAVSGSTITQGGDCVQMGSSLVIPGALYFCNNAAGDQVFMDDDYIVPGPAVKLGLAPAGTAPELVDLTTTATVQETGEFTGSLPAPAEPGDYVVVAEACHGANNCALSTTSVTI